jgi:hypothetical protein
MELASTYLLESPTRRKSSLKPPLPFFSFFGLLGSTSPEQATGCQEEEEVFAPRFFYGYF